MKKVYLILIGILFSQTLTFAQVAINTTGASATASAILDVSSSSKGILIPRLTTNERITINSPANGLMVYDTETYSFWYFDAGNSGWVEVITSASSDINTLTDGKSDATSVFIGNNAGLNNSNMRNTAIGIDALKTNTDGYSNTASGYQALLLNTAGSENTSSGAYSLYNNTSGGLNTVIGAYALYSNTTGLFNTAIGTYADANNQEGGNNTIIGCEAGKGLSTHNKSGNIFLGYQAGYNETGNNKLYIENSNSSTPLIGGDFANDSLFFNGVVRITGGSPGTGKILTSDDNGNATWENNAAATDINGLSDGRSDGNSIFLGEGAGVSDDFTSNNNIGIGRNSLNSITTGSANIAIGKNSSNAATTAYGSIAIGEDALLLNTDHNAIAIGTEALKNNGTGATLPYHSNINIAIGTQSLSQNTTGYSNTSIGSQALMRNTIGYDNIAVGASSLYTNTTGYENTAIGHYSLNLNTNSGNIAIGTNSMKNSTIGYNNLSLGNYSLYYSQDGNYNLAMGNYSLYNNLSGYSNVSIGCYSDYNNQNGDNNTIIGYAAGRGTSTHSKSGNIFLGFRAGYNETGDNKLYIENSNSSTPLIGGDFANDSLFFNGVVRITGGAPGADKVLTSDAIGNATWETPYWATELNDLSDASTQSASLFIGSNAGAVTVNYYNIGVGDYALKSNTSGARNTAIGFNSLYSNIDSDFNCAIGFEALKNNTGEKNTAIGTFSASNTTSGSNNITMGYASNYLNQTGSNNTIIGHEAGRGTSLHNKSGNIFLGYQAGYNETGDNKLYIENSNSSAPLIGGDFNTDELYFNTNKVGIGTSSPREILEVASRTNSYGRMIVSDGGGNDRNVILLVSPTASNQTARIEAYNYGTSNGLTLNFNTAGNGNSIFGGNILPENHISKNLGASGQAWNNVYAHNYITQGSAAFADTKVTKQLINFPPTEKPSGAFDEFTEKGLKELDPSSLPKSLKENNAILIDEMTTYNYKANYEQQLQIENLINESANQKKMIEELKEENKILMQALKQMMDK